jgi:hypothetical protein
MALSNVSLKRAQKALSNSTKIIKKGNVYAQPYTYNIST